MKTTILLASAAGLAVAQNLSGEPACATPCLASAISAICTPASDVGCACASQTAVASLAVSCLLSSCNSDDLVIAQSAGNAVCVDYSATASGATGAPSSTATPSAGGNNSTTSGSSSETGTITSSASLTSSTSATSGSSDSSSATDSAASASSTAGAAYVQGSTAVGAGVLGMFLAAVAAL